MGSLNLSRIMACIIYMLLDIKCSYLEQAGQFCQLDSSERMSICSSLRQAFCHLFKILTRSAAPYTSFVTDRRIRFALGPNDIVPHPGKTCHSELIGDCPSTTLACCSPAAPTQSYVNRLFSAGMGWHMCCTNYCCKHHIDPTIPSHGRSF